MGATNCPETPRQRMIGMMYLVLTAMLALNVSKEIIDAFSLVDETLVNSNKNLEIAINSDMTFLQKQLTLWGEAKVGTANKAALELQAQSDEMVNYIEKVKSEMLIAVDGTDKNEKGELKSADEIESKDNYDKSMNYFINEKHATELKEKLETYRKNIVSYIPEKEQAQYEKILGLELESDYRNANNEPESWETHNFDHVISIACYTLLNKIVGEVRNAESIVLKRIIANITGEDYNFDKVEGRAIPKTRMVFSGDSYEADIVVAAYDSKSSPEVYYKMGVDTLRESDLNVATKLSGENGVVKLKLGANGEGDQKFAGIIRVKRPDGSSVPYSFKDKYTVLRPSATVAAERMNVLYAGLENELAASAPIDPNKLSVSIAGCTVNKVGNGKYKVLVPSSLIGKTVTATVTGDLGGRMQTMGSNDFRVKQVPTPQAFIGGSISTGKKTKNEILANPLMTAQMGADFVYDLRWNITSYKVIISNRGIEGGTISVSGPRFSDAVQAAIKRTTTGDLIIFTDIQASSTAGSRNLDEITVRIR